jgi:hypothetical protein
MRKLFLTGFLAVVAYVALVAYETAAGTYAVALSAAHDRVALADSLQ